MAKSFALGSARRRRSVRSTKVHVRCERHEIFGSTTKLQEIVVRPERKTIEKDEDAFVDKTFLLSGFFFHQRVTWCQGPHSCAQPSIAFLDARRSSREDEVDTWNRFWFLNHKNRKRKVFKASC
ncbi:hypothetical protein M409DRAFT_53857 [Zasmidium cellare ATCC 36951]|uniref:Uncharacterized protein n=1 Tax=Zasmidium cellare ATCC 36951 TaxID=1080233 RepID=A0A6A6CNU1_ZASCE|nr:uncharacterized protein M409DRAFT_53857 [Zasmidium cellare ATCC 36951]KAF2167908.1 hypothetical protein M409DRAFT_53857 [Zasmidium cellare ATCC 36951]